MINRVYAINYKGNNISIYYKKLKYLFFKMNTIINNEVVYNQQYNNLKNTIEEWYNKNIINSKDKDLKGLLNELKKNQVYDNIELYNDKKEDYRNDIYKDFSENFIENLDLEIVFCNTPQLISQWNYYKLTTSSAITADSFGQFKYMIKDKSTNKYIGIVQLSNDIITKEDRDIFIGWKMYKSDKIKDFEKKKNKTDKEKIELMKWKEVNKILDKMKTDKVKHFKINGYNEDDEFEDSKYSTRLNYIVNISCCVGLQPIAYNLNVGKLLVASVFSKEVMEEYFKRYNRYYAGVITESLYGKSIQYDRMNEIKYIGKTSGYGTCHLPNELKDEIKEFMKTYHNNEYEKCQKMTSSSMRLITYCCKILQLKVNILNHGLERGIYFGYTGDDSKDFLMGKKNIFTFNSKIREFNNIVEWWKDRWAIQRWNNLMLNNKVKIKLELYDFTKSEKINQQSRQIQFEKMKDNNWVSIKREKNRVYYYENKDKLLEQVKVEVEKDLIQEVYIDPSYLAGFFDGDGSIYITNGCLHITFSQCVLNILLQIQKKYGGTIFKQKRVERVNNRTEFTLKICGEDCTNILNDLKDTSILKVDRINYGIQYLEYNNKPMTDEKQSIINDLKISNQKKNDDEKYMNRINLKYICGLFDAEGCICIDYNNVLKGKYIGTSLSIAQKYVPTFMKSMQTFMINELSPYVKNKITEKSIRIGLTSINISRSDLIKSFYEICKNIMIVKRYQFDLLMKLYDEYDKKDKDLNKLKEYSIALKNNKHIDIEYDIDIDEVNMVAFLKSKIIKNIDTTEKDEIHKLNKTKQLQKEKKQGINNINYGKIRSVDHRYKISLSTILKKREKSGLTDEKINQILSYKEDYENRKILQIKISKMFKLKRYVIADIFANKIMPTNHPDFKKILMEDTQKSYDQDIQNLNNDSSSNDDKTILNEEDLEDQKIKKFFLRTSLNFDEMIKVILWRKKQNNNEKIENKKILAPKVAEILSNELNKKVTLNMVKSLWGYRTQLTKRMFSPTSSISYEEYLEIINFKS